MKKILINMAIALVSALCVSLILRFLHIDEMMVGWISCMVFMIIFYLRKGSGLRLISEEKLVEIDKKEDDV